MKLARLAAELVLDALLIALIGSLVSSNWRPARPTPAIGHDPARCSACAHPNARVGAGALGAPVREDG